jgi:hypothetical protein
MTAVDFAQPSALARNGSSPDRTGPVADRILSGALILAVVGVAVQTLVDSLDVWALDRRVELLLADSDVGIFAWASVAATFAAALGALLLATAGTRDRKLLCFVAGAVAFLSLDDQVRLHERAGDLADRAESLALWEPARLLWPLIWLPLLGAAFVGLWRVAGRLPRRPGGTVVLGLVLLAAAVALEVLSSVVIRSGSGRGSALYELEVLLEEGAELAGWILIAGALVSAFVLSLRAAPLQDWSSVTTSSRFSRARS